MKSIFTAVVVALFTINAFAFETKITITSDVDKEVGELILETANGKADTLRIQKVLDYRILSDESHPVESLMTDGLVATERDGYEVVILKLQGFDLMKGGTVVVDYLVNGLTRNRRTYKLKFVKEGGQFVLRTLEGKQVNHLHFTANRVLRKVVGIKSVTPSFK